MQIRQSWCTNLSAYMSKVNFPNYTLYGQEVLFLFLEYETATLNDTVRPPPAPFSFRHRIQG